MPGFPKLFYERTTKTISKTHRTTFSIKIKEAYEKTLNYNNTRTMYL